VAQDKPSGARQTGHVVHDAAGGRGAEFGSRHYSLTLGGGFPRIAAKYVVEAPGKRHDVFKLATQCMDEWETYLKVKGLLPR
jgi:hypothetical protein